MSIELRGSEQKAIQALWAKWKSSDALEMESTVKSVSLTEFLDTVARLRAVGLREQPQQPKLNICMPGCLRFTIVGSGAIQDYCMKGDITKVPFTVMRKARCNTRGLDDDQIDLPDYGVRLKLRKEENLDRRDARVVEMIGRWQKTPKRFRYIKRYTFLGPEKSGLRFDLSIVRESGRDSKGDLIGSESFQIADILRKPMKYEIEAEAERTEGSKTMESERGIVNGLSLILQGMQRSFVLVRRSVADNVVKLIAAATGARPYSFPGPQPATLVKDNITMDVMPSVPNVRFENYNVTDKADGLRCLLVVAENGRIYLADSGFRIYATGLATTVGAGTILDGEWIRNDKNGSAVSLFYAFDIYTSEGQNVAALPFLTADSDNHRMAAMKKVVDALSTAKQTVRDIPANHSLIISMKTFYSTGGDAGYIFNDAAACLDAAAASPYYTDGLIFTPNDAPLPLLGRTWGAQLKWKPPHDNTIDFLVAFEKGAETGDKIGFKYNEDEKQMLRHKTLRLFVGGKTDVVFRDPRDSVLTYKQLPDSIDTEDYRPVEFRPMEPADASASICHLGLASEATASSDENAVDVDTLYCTRTKDPITTNSIVEMAYHPERAPGWRWEPIRVRWDKTERLQRGEYGRTMNADWVADDIWLSIHNPITEDMIRTGVMVEDAVEDKPGAYYSSSGKKAAKRDNFIVRKLNSFHNLYIKSELLLQKTLRKGDSLLDLACGRGGDIKKWVMNKAGWVLGVDYNLENITASKDGIYGRYLDMKITSKGQIPPMIFVQGDSTRSIKDATSGVTDFDKGILRTLFGSAEQSQSLAAVEAMKGQAGKGFDVVSCMFALHYMFKDRDSVDGFLSNVADNLKIGGYFIGCCFDGDTVHRLLAGLPEGGVKTGRDKDTDIWSIRRSYDSTMEDVLPASDDGLGKAIDVFYYSIGEEHREYLVSFEYLTRRMATLGCELLNPSELATLGLSHSTNMFGESHKMTGAAYTMSKSLKEFSFLNRWFIFRRKTAGKVDAVPLKVAMVAAPSAGVVPQRVELAPTALTVSAVPEAAAEAVAATRPVFKFFHGAVLKDELKVGRKDWARYISPSTYSRLRDMNDASIIYPSLDAAFASTLYQLGTDKPELGATLFSVNSNIHQSSLKAQTGASDKRVAEILEEELIAIRTQMKPVEIKRTGAKFNEAKYLEGREAMMQWYVQQRYDTDSEFKRVMDTIKARNGLLVFYNGPKPSELGGLVRDEGRIEGQNKLGIMYMRTVGLTQ